MHIDAEDAYSRVRFKLLMGLIVGYGVTRWIAAALAMKRAVVLQLYTHFIIPFGKFGPPYLGKATAAARAALPSLQAGQLLYVSSAQNTKTSCSRYFCTIRHQGLVTSIIWLNELATSIILTQWACYINHSDSMSLLHQSFWLNEFATKNENYSEEYRSACDNVRHPSLKTSEETLSSTHWSQEKWPSR